MALTYAIGSDGSATMPTGFKAAINTWSATLARTTQVVTGFGDSTARRRASGVIDITGSAGGVPQYDASTTSAFGIATSGGASGLVLQIAANTTLTMDCVFSSVAFNVTQDGDSTVTFNFEVDTTVAYAWDESA
jgi:hypothetical protein